MLALEAGGETGEHPYSPRHGEKFGIVIQGKIVFTLEQNEYVLEEGDGVYFNSSKPYNWKNISRKKAKIILVIPAPLRTK